MVLLQEQVEPDYLGRVMGVMGMIGSAAMPLGMLLFGPLADLVRIEWLLVGTGLVMGAQAVAMALDRALTAHGETTVPTSTDRPD
jgi:DHA3 family macrolide efflux protein-like MFS transporter